MTTQPRFTYPIEYPESDGQPIAETDWHRTEMMSLLFMLEARYRDDPEVYVTGNMFIYYEEGNPTAVFAPDVCVVFGVPKRMRRIYKLWEEHVPPAVVFELSSRKTWLEDKGNKMTLCAELGVAEYYLFDPELDYLKPPLQGFRLEHGAYQPIAPDTSGSLHSERLGVALSLEGWHLQLVDVATGQRIPRPEEESASRQAADARLTYAQARADREAAARQAAEAEAERLRAELERLRRSGNDSDVPTTD
jgi:Uma2 family endonuclease